MIFEPNTDLAFFVLRLAAVILLLAEGSIAVRSSAASRAYITGILMIAIAASFALGVLIQIAASVLMLIMLYRIYDKTVRQSMPFTGSTGWELDFLLLAVSVTLLFAHPTGYSIFL